MDREYYNLERRENDHKTTFKKSANANGYKKIDIEKDDFGQSSADDEEENAIPGADLRIKSISKAISKRKFHLFRLMTENDLSGKIEVDFEQMAE